MASDRPKVPPRPAPGPLQPANFFASSWASSKKFIGSTTQEIKQNVQESFEDMQFNPAGVVEEARSDTLDTYRKARGEAGLCSKCESLSIKEFRTADTETIHWETPLTRILYHAEWCILCRFLLDMLCRPENDPFQHPEVAQYLQDDLTGISMAEWSVLGWKFAEENWPFGRSEFRPEGATHRFGHAAEQAQGLFKDAYSVMALTRRMDRRSSQMRRADPKGFTSYFGTALNAMPSGDVKRLMQRKVDEGREMMTQYLQPCVLSLRLITSKNQFGAGMVFAALRGYGNRPDGTCQNLSSFRLRLAGAGVPRISQPDSELWYGNVVDRKWMDLSIGRRWIRECLEKHGDECSRPSWSTSMQSLDFLRVIDVEQMCLVQVQHPESCRFVALSYKWGNAKSCMLLAGNLLDWSQPGGLSSIIDSFPLTILDAIQVVRCLGERYLWVDSLCIQQDESDEKMRQIAAMDRVYGTALLTIVASSGDSADSGLRGIKSGLSKSRTGKPRDLDQPSAKLDQDGTCIIAPFQNTQQISQSPWASRAWTFQEKVLSRRMLVFCGEEAVWHCRGMVCREDMMNVDSENRCEPLEWLRLHPQHFRPFEGPDPYWVDGSFVRDKNNKTHLVRSSAFGEYAKIVRAFSSRQLTNKADVISALQGLLNIFSQALLSEFQYGLPESLLDVALLWTPREPLTRRETSTPFPSWSWVGWEGITGFDNCLAITRNEYGRAMGVERKELGDEGIRPMVYWYMLGKAGLGLRRQNSVLASMTEIPPEWEGAPCGSSESSCSDLEAQMEIDVCGVELLRHHLVFQTSCTDCSFTSMNGANNSQPTEQGLVISLDKSGVTNRPVKAQIKDADGRTAGRLILDTQPPEVNTRETLLCVVAESQPFDLGFDCRWTEEYSCYAVLLLQKCPDSGTYERLGSGKIWKTSWGISNPFPKTVVLG